MKKKLKKITQIFSLTLVVIVIAYVVYNYTQPPISISFERTDEYAPKFALINRDSIGVYIPYILTVKNHRLAKEEYNGIIDEKEKYWKILNNKDPNLSYDKRGQTKEERRNIRDEENIWKQISNIPDRLYRAIIRTDYEIFPLCSQEFVFYTIHLYSFQEMKITRLDYKPILYRDQLEKLDQSLPISIAHLNIDSLYQSDQMKPIAVFLKEPYKRCYRYVKYDSMSGNNPIYVNYKDSVDARGLTKAEDIVNYLWNVLNTDPIFKSE